MINFKLKFP